jgi:hypothetical protein
MTTTPERHHDDDDDDDEDSLVAPAVSFVLVTIIVLSVLETLIFFKLKSRV